MKKKSHNVFSLMLDPRFKTLHLVPSLIGCEQRKAIVEKNNKFFLFLMFFKCHYYLHPSTKFERGIVDQRIEKDNNLNIFEMITNTIKSTMELINRELLMFRHYQMDVKDIKCLL